MGMATTPCKILHQKKKNAYLRNQFLWNQECTYIHNRPWPRYMWHHSGMDLDCSDVLLKYKSAEFAISNCSKKMNKATVQYFLLLLVSANLN